MGMNIQKEEQQREQALAREQQRQEEKQAKREALMNTTSYRVMDATANRLPSIALAEHLQRHGHGNDNARAHPDGGSQRDGCRKHS